MTILQRSRSRGAMLTGLVVVALTVAAAPVRAQTRDSLLNGVAIGAVVGGAAGVAFTHAVRDSDLVFSQYASGALIFGAIGAGIGLAVDAALNRQSAYGGVASPRLLVAPRIWRGVAGVRVVWRWP